MRHEDKDLARRISKAAFVSFIPLFPGVSSSSKDRDNRQPIPTAALRLITKSASQDSCLLTLESLFDGDDRGLRSPLHQSSRGKGAEAPLLGVVNALKVAHDSHLIALTTERQGGSSVSVWAADRGTLKLRENKHGIGHQIAHAGLLADTLVCVGDAKVSVKVTEGTSKSAWITSDVQNAVALCCSSDRAIVLSSNGECALIRKDASIQQISHLPEKLKGPLTVVDAKLIRGKWTCCVVDSNGALSLYDSPYENITWKLLGIVPDLNLKGKETSLAIAGNRKVALLDQDRLLILDPTTREFSDGIDHCEAIKPSTATSFAWASSGQILALAEGSSIRIIAQACRGYYEEKSDSTSSGWQPIASIDCGSWARRISSIVFDDRNYLYVATANIIRSFRPVIGKNGGMVSLQEAAARSNGPKPYYHPTILQQCLLWGRVDLARDILCQVARTLRDAVIEADEPIDIPDLDANAFWHQAASSASDFDGETPAEEERNTLTQSLVDVIRTRLPTASLRELSTSEQQSLKRIAQVVHEVDQQQKSLDESGVRYLVALRDFAACNGLSDDKASPSALEGRVKYRDIVWAFHSDTQEILIRHIESLFHQKGAWSAARATGLLLWIRSPDALRQQAENVARSQYMQGEDRDPIACSLLYYALGKQKLVLNLWRQSVGHPEQRKMITFLSNDFTIERWKAAAQKNAYALLSQRRFGE